MTEPDAREPLGEDEITALAEHLQHADPAALHVPNGTVVRLIAMLNAEHHRADIAELDLAVALDNWNGDG